jgi:hypothetical protein
VQASNFTSGAAEGVGDCVLACSVVFGFEQLVTANKKSETRMINPELDWRLIP